MEQTMQWEAKLLKINMVNGSLEVLSFIQGSMAHLFVCGFEIIVNMVQWGMPVVLLYVLPIAETCFWFCI